MEWENPARRIRIGLTSKLKCSLPNEMARNEKAAGNMAMKSHVFAQQKMPSIGADVLPGSKGTESETDVELPGVFGDEQTPQNS
jgi:hypothetical protein